MMPYIQECCIVLLFDAFFSLKAEWILTFDTVGFTLPFFKAILMELLTTSSRIHYLLVEDSFIPLRDFLCSCSPLVMPEEWKDKSYQISFKENKFVATMPVKPTGSISGLSYGRGYQIFNNGKWTLKDDNFK